LVLRRRHEPDRDHPLRRDMRRRLQGHDGRGGCRPRLQDGPQMSAHPSRCAAAMVVAAALLPGCPCTSPDTLFADEFEGCSGTCDWTVTGTGSVEVASTILAGEHGLRLTGDVTASKAIRGAVSEGGSSHVHLTLMSNCGSALDVSITREDNGGAPQD